MFGLSFHLYGFILGLAVLSGIMAAEKKAKDTQHEGCLSCLPYVIVGGFIGARVYHLITDFPKYASSGFLSLFAVWNGGLAIYGGILGGLIGFVIWKVLQRKRMDNTCSFLTITDLASVSLPLAQSIGRWGNYINQELYGKPTLLPWGITIDSMHRLPGFEQISQYHPLFLYESIPLFLFWLILWKKTAQKKWNIGTGVATGAYLLFYAFLRFILDFLRISPAMVSFFSVAQWMSLLFAGLGLWLVTRRKA